MATRTAASETPTTSGSKPVHGTERFGSDPVDKMTHSFGAAWETLNTFGTVSQRVGSEMLQKGTSAVRDGFEVSATVTSAVFDATKDSFASLSSPASFDPLSSWTRLVETSAQAYTDYATRLAASAEDATEKIREAVVLIADEVHANAARSNG